MTRSSCDNETFTDVPTFWNRTMEAAVHEAPPRWGTAMKTQKVDPVHVHVSPSMSPAPPCPSNHAHKRHRMSETTDDVGPPRAKIRLINHFNSYSSRGYSKECNKTCEKSFYSMTSPSNNVGSYPFAFMTNLYENNTSHDPKVHSLVHHHIYGRPDTPRVCGLPHLSTVPLHEPSVDVHNQTALHIYLTTTPVSSQTLEEVRRLTIQCGTSSLLHRDASGQCPLHHACHTPRKTDIVRFLLESDPRAACLLDASGSLPFHQCVSSGGSSVETLRKLWEANPGAVLVRDGSGDLPLHKLCRRWHPRAVGRFLLEVGPEAARLPDGTGRLPLVLACEWRVNHATTEELCRLYPEAASVADSYGDLPLHVLCRTFPEDVPELTLLEALVCANPSAVALPNSDGDYPYQAAAEWVLSTARIGRNFGFYHWPSCLSSGLHVRGLDVHRIFLKAAPQVAPRATVYMCQELDQRPTADCNHLVTALALRALVLANHPSLSTSTSRRCLLRAALSTEGFNERSYQILFGGPQWKDANQLLRIPYEVDGKLPLHEALDHQKTKTTTKRTGKEEALILALHQAYPEASARTDSDGKKPLDYALQWPCSLAVVQALTESHPSALAGRDADQLPLVAASRDADLDVVFYLLQQNPLCLLSAKKSI